MKLYEPWRSVAGPPVVLFGDDPVLMVALQSQNTVSHATVCHLHKAGWKNGSSLYASPPATFTFMSLNSKHTPDDTLGTNVAIQSRDNVHSCTTRRGSSGDLIWQVLARSVTATERAVGPSCAFA
jgi:hypothetical protein